MNDEATYYQRNREKLITRAKEYYKSNKERFNSEPVYDKKYIKTKIKAYNNRIITNIQGNKRQEDNDYCTYLPVILLDSVVKTGNGFYPQIFLEECKYAVKKKKIMNTINQELDLDESDEASDNDKSNESNEDQIIKSIKLMCFRLKNKVDDQPYRSLRYS